MDRACFLSQQLVARQPGSRRHLSLVVPMGTIGEPNGCDWFCARHLVIFALLASLADSLT